MEQSFLRLDPGAEPSAAHERLVGAGARWAVIRSAVGGSVRWFAIRAEEALTALATSTPTVSEALSLRSRAPSASCTIAELEGVQNVAEPTVVLADDRVVAVLSDAAPVPDIFSAPPPVPERADDLTRRSGGAAAEQVTFSADAHIDAPHRVRLNEPFAFTISLADPAALAGDGRLTLSLDRGVTRFELDVQLFAQGIDASPEKTAVMAVDATDVSASRVAFELTATQPPDEVLRLVEAGETTEWQTSITVMFLRGGPLAGSMVHPLIVELEPAQTPASAGDEWLRDAETADVATLTVPSLPTPDLTITVSGTAPTDGVDGRYEVFLRSPHRTLPGDPYVLNLGMDAAAFAAQKYAQIKEQDGGSLGFRTLAGVGSQIANLLGDRFWSEVNTVLETAAASHGDTPTVLLLTSDPHVPWELAHLGATPVDSGAPPFLAAQARVGRWILDPRNHIAMPDTVDFRVDNVAAVIGEYDPMEMKKGAGTWKRLPEAEAEGEFLQKKFGAASLSAEAATVNQLLARKLDPPPQLLHFACHGTSMPGSTALIANDGTTIPDIVFEQSIAGREDRPFIFLNACRVGAAAEAANQYGGFAGSFLRAGSTGFIGPLWEVDDTLAKDIATDFYQSIASGISPAEVLRRTRAKFADAGDGQPDPPSTYMAYVYYGHPATLITGVRRELKAP